MNEIKGKLIETSLLESFRLSGKYTKTEALEIMESVFERNPFFALMLVPISESDDVSDEALAEIFAYAYRQTNGDLNLLNEVLAAEMRAESNGDKNIINEMLNTVKDKEILPLLETEMVQDKFGNFKPKSKTSYKDVDLDADEQEYLKKVQFIKLKDDLYSSKPQPVIWYGQDDYRARCEVLIIRGDEVLIDRGKDRAGFGYSLPGGGLDPSEPIAHCAARECEEEALIIPRNIRYMNIAWREDFPKPKLYNSGAISFVCVAEFGGKFRGNVDAEDRDEFADRAVWENYRTADLGLPHREAIERYLGRKIFEGYEFEYKDIKYIPLLEGEGDTFIGHVKKTVSDTADDAGKATKGLVHTVGTKFREAKTAIAKSDNPIIRQFIKWYEWAINYDNEEDKREAVITGSAFIRIRRIFGKYLLYYTLRPAIIAALPGGVMFKLLVGLVTWVAATWDWLGKEIAAPVLTNSDPAYERARNRVVQELELELKMTREKIEDARSANNVKAKYELMRVENKIEGEIARIKYGSKR